MQAHLQFSLAKWLLRNDTNGIAPDLRERAGDSREAFESMLPEHVARRALDCSGMSAAEFRRAVAAGDGVLVRHTADVTDAEMTGLMWCAYVRMKTEAGEAADAVEFCLATFVNIPDSNVEWITGAAYCTTRDIQMVCTPKGKCWRCAEFDIDRKCCHCGLLACSACCQRVCAVCRSDLTPVSRGECTLSARQRDALGRDGVVGLFKHAARDDGDFFVVDQDIDCAP